MSYEKKDSKALTRGSVKFSNKKEKKLVASLRNQNVANSMQTTMPSFSNSNLKSMSRNNVSTLNISINKTYV